MSYQQAIRDVVTWAAAERNVPAIIDVMVARPGSFDMKVVLTTDSGRHERVFDLANGLSPRTRKGILDWVAPILAPANSGTEPESVPINDTSE